MCIIRPAYSRGGMNSLSYKLAKPGVITGFGKKGNIKRTKFRGGAGEEEGDPEIIEDAQPKRSRGRPKIFTASSASVAPPEMEENYYDYKTKYKDSAIENLNKALNALRLESIHIKRSVSDPTISRGAKEDKTFRKGY